MTSEIGPAVPGVCAETEPIGAKQLTPLMASAAAIVVSAGNSVSRFRSRRSGRNE